MKKTTNNTTENITKRVDLQNLLGIEKKQVVKENKQLSEKAQLMKDVNNEMHKLLVTKYKEYYKEITTDVVVKQKDGNYNIKSVSGYYLLFPKKVTLNTKEGKKANYDGFSICKPTLYVKGGSSYECLDFTEIGKTTYHN